MNSGRKRLSHGLGAVMIWSVACLSLVACGWFARALMGSPVRQQGVAPRSAPSVAVASVAEEVFNPPEEFVGHVEPVQEVDILPQIEGYIKDRVGDPAKRAFYRAFRDLNLLNDL